MNSKIFKIFILGFLLFNLTGCFGEKELCNDFSNDEIMYLAAEATIKFEFKESVEQCSKGTEKYNQNSKTIVTDFTLVNNKAKSVFEKVEFKNKSLEETLKLFSEIATKNNLAMDNANIYTTSSKDYSSSFTTKVKNTIVPKDEIDTKMNKKVPLNVQYEFKVETGMEYYFEYYKFISDDEVKYYTKDLCYGECDKEATYKYEYNYDIASDTILITIADGNNTKYTYNFKDEKLEYGDNTESNS